MLKPVKLIDRLVKAISSALNFRWNRNVLGPVRKTGEVYGGSHGDTYSHGDLYVIAGVEGEFFARVFDLKKTEGRTILIKEDGYQRVSKRPTGDKVFYRDLKSDPLSDTPNDNAIKETLQAFVAEKFKKLPTVKAYQDLSIR